MSAGDDLVSAALKLLALELALLAWGGVLSEAQSEARTALIGGLAEALLDGSTPLLAAPFLQALYHRASSTLAVLDSSAKVRLRPRT